MRSVWCYAPCVPEQVQESMELREGALDTVQDSVVLEGTASGWRRRRARCCERLGQSGIGTAKTAILQLKLRRKRLIDVKIWFKVMCIDSRDMEACRFEREQRQHSIVIR